MKEMIRVVLVEPMKHPRLVEVEHTLENLQGLVGAYIAASYPWEDRVALVYDDDGKAKSDNLPNRLLEDYDLMVGPFFICGIDTEDFISISDELAEKYMKKFWNIELFFRTEEGIVPIILVDDDEEEGAEDEDESEG